MRQHWKNTHKKIFILRENVSPYTFSLMGVGIIYIFLNSGFISSVETDISNFSNTMISVASIFGSFLMASLAIILQSPKNENIILLKDTGLYSVLIRYFKEAMLACFLVAIFSLPLSLGYFNNSSIYLLIYLLLILGMLSLDFRVFHLLFKSLHTNN